MFITDDDSARSTSRFGPPTGRTGIFSLSSSAPDSPAFYVGLEDHIVEVGITEDISQFADPAFEDPHAQGPKSKYSVFRQRRQPLNLVLYEHPQASDPRTRNIGYSQYLPRATDAYRNALPGWDRRWRNSLRPY